MQWSNARGVMSMFSNVKLLTAIHQVVIYNPGLDFLDMGEWLLEIAAEYCHIYCPVDIPDTPLMCDLCISQAFIRASHPDMQFKKRF